MHRRGLRLQGQIRDAAGRRVPGGGDKPGPTRTQRQVQDEGGLPFPLLSDQDHAVAGAFGAWGTKSLYGKKFEGLIRSTFLVGDGNLDRAWRNVKAKGHVAKVTADLLGN